MIKLYSAPRTRGIRVAWLLEELEVDYELVNGEFEQTKSEFFIQKTPTGKYPTIDDDGFIMFESGAIIEYLLEKHGDKTLAPAVGDPLRGRYLQWFHFADATAFSPLGIYLWLAVYRDDAANHPDLISDAYGRARTGLALLEKELQGKTWLLGDQFSASDIMMGFTVQAAQLLGMVDEGSATEGYIGRLVQRPAFQRAAEKTGNADLL